jgi:hypothetical protein
MQPQISQTSDASQLAMIQRKLFLDNRIRSGMGWFYAIAGLSIVNTVIYLAGARLTFVVGLGATQVVDGFTTGLIRSLGQGWSALRVLALGIDVALAGVFALFGYLGRKRYRWAIILGMVLYILDGLILLYFKDFLGAAFHAWALVGIWGGLKAIQDLKKLEEAGTSESIESIRQRIPVTTSFATTPPQTRTRTMVVLLLFLVLVATFVIISMQR